MKKATLLITLLICFTSSIYAQTNATNFNTADCQGNNHDLFTELNSGKIIVIAWVMPCGGCISGALAGYSAVESFASSNPSQVVFYLADDYANTTCSTLNSWRNTNGMTSAISFSNAAVNMGDYGAPGMPKVVVLGGGDHAVLYNKNNGAINQTEITAAINSALATSSLSEIKKTNEELVIYPNPSNDQVVLDVKSLDLNHSKEISIVLKNSSGKEVMVIFQGKIESNQSTIQFSSAELSNGNYFIHYSDNEKTKISQVVVSH